MINVLIIGANSYIGKSFQRYISLIQANDLFVHLVSASNGDWTREDFSLYDVVLLLSGIVHRKEKKDMWEFYDNINHRMPIAIAKKAKEYNIKQFIFMSTAAVYGEKVSCITKETKPNPATYYGKSKFTAEQELIKLQSKEFNIVIVRPPMVYGEGCKGNYQRLVKLAKLVPVFPAYHNKRSMIHIDNLCKFIYDIIIEKRCGYYHPQDKEYIDTCNLVIKIRQESGKKTLLTAIFNPLIRCLAKNSRSINKMFGDFFYDKKLT